MAIDTVGDVWKGPDGQGNWAGILNVGNSAFGSLLVDSGSRVLVPDAAFSSQSIGPVLVSIGGDWNGDGRVRLTDADSGIDLINSSGNDGSVGLWVGRREGTGYLEIINGADLQMIQEAEFSAIIGIGNDLGSVGEVRLDNGRLDVSAAGSFGLLVGRDQGRGELHLDNGSRIDVTNQSAQQHEIGYNGGTGILTLSGQSQYISKVEGSDVDNFMIVGGEGGDGTLLLNDARLELVADDGNAGLRVGYWINPVSGVGANGDVRIENNARVIIDGAERPGAGGNAELWVGGVSGSHGDVTINSGGSVTFSGTGNNQILVGAIARVLNTTGGTGELEVRDAGSVIDGANLMLVGYNNATGIATIANGGQIRLTQGTSNEAGLAIGVSSFVTGNGGNGTLTVRDAGSLVSLSGSNVQISVGYADSTGRMTVSDGARISLEGSSASELWIGRGDGNGGNGTVDILTGATVDLGGNGILRIGVTPETPAANIGNLSVVGEGSSLVGLERAEVGQLGATGTLEVAQGGLVSVAGTLTGGMADGSPGTARIIINDGTLEAGSITLYGGLVAGGGLLEAAGSGEGFATFQNTDLFIGDRQNDADALIADIGTLTVSGDLAKTDGRAIFDIAEAGTDQLLVDGALSFTGTTIVLNIANEAALPDGAIRLAQAEDGITLDDVSFDLSGLGGSVETELRENGTELWVDVSGSGSQQLETLTFEQTRDAFQVERLGPNQVIVTDATGNRVEHTDIGRIDFEDGSLLFDVDSANLGFTYRIYAAAYGRTPDEDGLRFWIDTMDFLDSFGPEPDNFDFLAREFLTAPEYLSLYGSDPSDMEYVDAMYQNVLGRLPDQEGYDFWVGAMEDGLDRADILIYFAESFENQEQTAPDLNDGIWVV